MNNGRIVHLTLMKCGSQWVRDVLCAPEIVNFSNVPYSGVTLLYHTVGHLDLPLGTFSGPIYGMNLAEWLSWKCQNDRALVVLRDPRDRLVSLLFSILYSHGYDPLIMYQRKNLLDMKDHSERLDYLIGNEIESAMRFYRTWVLKTENDVHVVRYEELVGNQQGEFKEIINWLGWPVPDQILNEVVERLSFRIRSGRQPGKTDVFSHYRRGVVGDWQNYFTLKHGRLWESLYPGFLQSIGYEKDQNWWKSIPELNENPDAEIKINTEEILSLHNKKLEQQLIEKEKEIQNLALACRERLTVIEQLQNELNRLHEAQP